MNVQRTNLWFLLFIWIKEIHLSVCLLFFFIQYIIINSLLGNERSCLVRLWTEVCANIETIFQNQLVLMLYWNIQIFYEMKTGLGSMCFISTFQIFLNDNHKVLCRACICFQCSCTRMKGSFSLLTCCISNNSFPALANVNCHPWFMFINQNGKCIWSAESGSRLLSEKNVINHHWLASWVKLYKNVEKQMLLETRERKLGLRG